jgi:hypothetical protein
MKYIQHVLTPKSLTVVLRDGTKDVIKTFEASSNEYSEGVSFIRKKTPKKLVGLVEKKAPAGVKLNKDAVWFNDEKLPSALATKARQFIETKLNIAPLKAFWERCKLNPSEKSRQHLYRFVDKYGVTIIDQGEYAGFMLLYKGVNHNMTSHHDGKTLHTFGEPTAVDRDQCEFTEHNGCGYGLHSAPFEYVRTHYSQGTIIEVIVDPADVTSVPSNESKMRSWRYIPNCLADKKGLGIKSGLVATKKAMKKNAPKESSKKFFHIPFLESITITGPLTGKVGFSPGQKVKVWLGKGRAVILPSDLSDEAAKSRYKVSEAVEATVKPSGSLRIRALCLGKHLGVSRNGEFKAAALETNAIAIYKA